ncbi:MAG: fbpA 2 [Noviherbaspirillum sp.]|nr:fbpA 2 [Noviherbaspirillum sp.]
MSKHYLKQRRSVFASLAVVSLMSIAPFGNAANSPPKTLEELALYKGANRHQLLVEGAKKEGKFDLYTSIPVKDITALTDAFKKKYGVTATIWRAGSEAVTNRIITEARGGRYAFDVAAGASAQLEALSREKLVQKVNSPYTQKLMEGAVPNHLEWAPVYLNIFVQAFNTKQVKKEELPKRYEDLLDPKWKGRVTIEATDDDWFYAVVQQMGEEKGLQYFRNLSANGMSVRKGHTLLTQLVAAGEVPYALTVFSYSTRQVKNDGAPLDWHVIEPAIARSNGVAVSKKANNPHAALLFHDFLLSDGQKVLADMFYDPVNKDYQSATHKFPVKFINDQELFDSYAKWSKLFEDIVLKGRK